MADPRSQAWVPISGNPTSITPVAQVRVWGTVFGASRFPTTPSPIHSRSCGLSDRTSSAPATIQSVSQCRPLLDSLPGPLTSPGGLPPPLDQEASSSPWPCISEHPPCLPPLPSCAPLLSAHSHTLILLLMHEYTASVCRSAFVQATPVTGSSPNPTSISSNLSSSLLSSYGTQLPREAGAGSQRAMEAEPRACSYSAGHGNLRKAYGQGGLPACLCRCGAGGRSGRGRRGGVRGKQCPVLGASLFKPYTHPLAHHFTLLPCDILQEAQGL